MEYEFLCEGHNSIYEESNLELEGNYNKRNFKVYFSVPDQAKALEQGVGVVLIIAGFGGNANSKVYKKLRKYIADTYNMVAIQCDYFGWEFMQSSEEGISVQETTVEQLAPYMDEDELRKLRTKISNGVIKLTDLYECHLYKDIYVNTQAELQEEKGNFNDMSYMQALDNITATLMVINILYSNHYKVDTNKVIINGNSQGAYLAYLCNRMCPGLFTHILDNSAWDYPRYINGNRALGLKNGKLGVTIMYHYMARNIIKQSEKLRISSLYKDFVNTCYIVSYHGEQDQLISLKEKIREIENIQHIELNIISNESLTEGVFSSVAHGLGADYLLLFDKFYNEYIKDIKEGDCLTFDNLVKLDNGQIWIDYTTGRPYFQKEMGYRI